MATLKFLTEPDQHPTDDVRELLERLRAVFRTDPTENVWECWASVGAHGFTVRLQQARRVAPYGGRADGSGVTYSGGGTADFLVEDVSAWLRAQSAPQPRPLDPPHRRRLDARRRGDPSTD
jgi:hypothetical protein